MWEDTEKILSINLNILESKIYCRKLKLANRSDWRIPKYDELLTLIDYTKSKPANINKIKYINTNKYWTISENINEKNKYWYVNFKYGTSGFEIKSSRNKLRCVRDISNKKDEY